MDSIKACGALDQGSIPCRSVAPSAHGARGGAPNCARTSSLGLAAIMFSFLVQLFSFSKEKRCCSYSITWIECGLPETFLQAKSFTKNGWNKPEIRVRIPVGASKLNGLNFWRNNCYFMGRRKVARRIKRKMSAGRKPSRLTLTQIQARERIHKSGVGLLTVCSMCGKAKLTPEMGVQKEQWIDIGLTNFKVSKIPGLPELSHGCCPADLVIWRKQITGDARKLAG